MRHALLALALVGCDGARAKTVPLLEAPAPSVSIAPVANVLPPPPAFFPPRTFPGAVDGFVAQWYGKHQADGGARGYEPTENVMGNDGAQWVIERAKAGAYRLVERWSPTYDAASAAENAGFVRACDLFLDLAGRDLVTGNVY